MSNSMRLDDSTGSYRTTFIYLLQLRKSQFFCCPCDFSDAAILYSNNS